MSVQEAWLALRDDWFGGNDALLFVASVCAVHSTVFTVLNLMLHVCYKYELFPSWRVRPPKEYPPDSLIKECLIEAAINQLVIGPPLVAGFYYLMAWRGASCTEVPSALMVIGQILACMVVEDAAFYWLHRLLHHPRIYKHVHKKHHQFRYTVGIAAEYSHPIEAIFGVTMPFWIGPLLFKVPLFTVLIWLVLRTYEAVDSHSGYLFPWSPWDQFLSIQGGVERHDYHHSHNVGSYGSFFKFWDWIMGTDKSFDAWMAKKRAAGGTPGAEAAEGEEDTKDK